MNNTWLQQNNVPDWFHNSTNVSWEGDQSTGPVLKYKTADKEGSSVPYTLQNGQWVPQLDKVKTSFWDTNSSEQNKWLAIMAAGMAGGAGMSMLPGANIASLIPEAASFGGAGTAGAVGGAGAAAGIPWAGPVGMADAMGGGMFSIPGTVGAAGAAGGATSGLPSWLSSLGSKFGGTALSSLASGLFQDTGNPSAGGSKTGGLGGALGGALGSLTGGGSNLMDLLGAYYSSRSNEKLGDEYLKIWNQMQGNAAPFMNRLQDTYKDPGSFFAGPEYQALARVASNKFARQGAKAGTNANSIDDELLMQDHAAKWMDDYRKGLQGSVDSTQRQLAAFAPFMISGMQNSYGSLSPYFSMLGGANSNLSNIGKSAGTSIVDLIKSIWGNDGSGGGGMDTLPTDLPPYEHTLPDIYAPIPEIPGYSQDDIDGWFPSWGE
jgi:hypothetical protein